MVFVRGGGWAKEGASSDSLLPSAAESLVTSTLPCLSPFLPPSIPPSILLSLAFDPLPRRHLPAPASYILPSPAAHVFTEFIQCVLAHAHAV